MNVALSTFLYPVSLSRGRSKSKPDLNYSRKLSTHKKFSCSVTLATQTAQVSGFDLENKKHDVLRAVQDTQRGLVASADQRSTIEEALVSLEGCNIGPPMDLDQLDGTWRLQYTSASDVLVLLESAARLPFFQVGQIFQKFECRDQSNRGVVRNVVQWSIPKLLEEQEGATLLVSAKFDVVSMRNIYLQFEEVSFSILDET
uniref:Uncharacterized protein MANES_01G237100 n=1 Tax=Rhizophora mucronata TaxID=61149 RepID=A0A2P2LN48_RHIMU